MIRKSIGLASFWLAVMFYALNVPHAHAAEASSGAHRSSGSVAQAAVGMSAAARDLYSSGSSNSNLVAEDGASYAASLVALSDPPAGGAQVFSIGYPQEGKRKEWGANTSGPFFTGTAEVEPLQSVYIEPYVFNNREKGSSNEEFTQKMAIGLGHGLEFDALVPFTRNAVNSPGGLRGQNVSDIGAGDTQLSVKYELTTDSNTYKFFSRPAITVTGNIVIPTGNATNLISRLHGADQFGNGTWGEGPGLLVRKRFKPFVFYGQMGDLIVEPTTVPKGYSFDNQIGTVSTRRGLRMIDGNLFSYSAALEDVFNTKHGIGGLLEFTGEKQAGRNLIFGKATAPPFSYISMAPELEFTLPAGKRFAATWGGGVMIPLERGDYPRIVTPMMTVTLYFNGPNGSRNSD